MTLREAKKLSLIGVVVGLSVSVVAIALQAIVGFSLQSYVLLAIVGSICGVLAAKRSFHVHN
jgi:hypothetical protein